MKIVTLQKDVDKWIQEHGVRYFDPLTNLGILMEEVGEVARIMVREYGEQSKKKSEQTQNLSDEIADVMWVLTAIANQCNIDLTEALKKNFEKKNKRDRNRHKENKKLK